jgi:DNA-binding PadR family transcriptional regulator
MGDASGYEIRKQFEEGPFAYFHETSFGSIYPALTKLAADGMVTVSDVAQVGKPDKKVYAITEAGRKAFQDALHKTPVKDRIRSESLYMLFFADLLDADHRRAVYDEYLAYYRAQVERLRAVELALTDPDNGEAILRDAVGDSVCATLCRCLPHADEAPRAFARGFGLALYETVVRYLEENREAMIGSEKEAREKTA